MAALKLVIILSFISAHVSGKSTTAPFGNPAKSIVSEDAIAIDAEPTSATKPESNSTSSNGEYGGPAEDSANEGYNQLNINPYFYGVVDDKGSYDRPRGSPLSDSTHSESYGNGFNSNPDQNDSNDNTTATSGENPGTLNDDIVTIDNPDLSDSDRKPTNDSPSDSYGNPNNNNDNEAYGRPNQGIDVPTFLNGYGYSNSDNTDKTDNSYSNHKYDPDNVETY